MTIVRYNDNAILPLIEANSASFDLFSCTNDENSISVFSNGGVKLISTGIGLQLPEGYCVLLCPDAELIKNKISILNSPMIIENKNEIEIFLINFSEKVYEIGHGIKIAKAIIIDYKKPSECGF